MWRKRRRYMFRKQSRRGRILPMVVIGALVLIGLIWLAPGLALFSVDVDAPKVEDPEDRTEQAPAEDQQPEQTSANDQPEQETTKDQPEDEKAPKGAPPPPKRERASNNLPAPSPSPSPPPAAQPPTSSAPLSPPLEVEEVPKGYLYSNDYWDYYYEPSYYWDYYEPSYYYWNYWDY